MENNQQSYELTAQEVLEELVPLLRDSFIARVSVADEGVTLSFPGSQTFKLSIEKKENPPRRA